MTDTTQERFWAKVRIGESPEHRPGLGSCWIWTAGATAQGYGGFHPTKPEMVLAHRYSYELAVGPIPKGQVVDHLCRVRRCVNPQHLEAVSNEENLRRGAGYGLRNGMRDQCKNGHRYTAENTYVDPTKKTVRCRECARIRDRQPHRKTSYRRNQTARKAA